MYPKVRHFLDDPAESLAEDVDANENLVEVDVLSPYEWKQDLFAIALAFAGAAVLTAIYIPYTDVNIPQMGIWMAAMALSMLCLKFSQENYSYLLIIFAVYAPFQRVMPGDFGGIVRAFNITNVILLFMIVGWSSQGSIRGTGRFRLRAFDMVIVLFMFISTLSLIYGYYLSGQQGIESEHLLFPLKRWLEPMLVYFIFVNNLPDRKTITQISNACLLAFFFCTVISLKEFYLDKGGLGGTFSTLEKMRINGIADQPNEMAAFFCYYSFFYLSLFFHYIRQARYWVFLPLFLMAYQGMHLCFSRGGQLGFLAGTIATLILWKKRIFVAILVPLIFLLVWNPALIPNRFIGRLGNLIRLNPNYEGFENDSEKLLMDKSASNRLVIWGGAKEMIIEYPMFGVGFGRFRYHIGDYIPKALVLAAHSTYFLIACEMGLPALLVFLTIMIWGVRKAWFVFRNSEIQYFKTLAMGYIGGWCGLMIVNVFGSRLVVNEVTFYYWIFTAIMIRMSDLTLLEKERRPEKPTTPQILPML